MRHIPFLAIAIGLLVPAAADAGFEVRLTDEDANTVTITDGGALDSDGVVNGFIDYDGGIAGGDWASITFASASTKPLNGSATNPIMQVSVTAQSTAAGVLTIEVTDNYYGPTSSDPLSADLNLASALSSTGAVTLDGYSDIGNTIYAQTAEFLPGSPSITGIGNTTINGSADVDDEFSITMVMTLTHTSARFSDFNASLTAVPGPSALLLFATGCPFLGAGLLRRRRRQTV